MSFPLKSHFFNAIIFQTKLKNFIFRKLNQTNINGKGGEYVKTIIDFRTDTNGKGVRLNRADLETLLFLFEHKLVSQTQLYEFYSLFKHIHYDSFRKRMSKFAKNKIIQIKKYEFTKKKSGIVKNLILLDIEGYEILYAAGFLDEGKEEFLNWTNWDRTIATKEVVIEAIKSDVLRTGVLFGGEHRHLYIFNKDKALNQNLIEESDLLKGKMIYKKGEPPIYLSWQPLKSKFLSNVLYSASTYELVFNNLKPEIEPDWILGINQHIINIEIDLGYRTLIKVGDSETTSVDELLKKYVRLSKRHPQLKHNILYVYLDDSIPLRKNYGRKIQRIKNFKQRIMDDEIRQSSLNIFVLSLERSKAVLNNLLSIFRGEQSKRLIRKQVVTDLINNLNVNNGYSVLHLAGEQVHRLYPSSNKRINEAVLIRWKEEHQLMNRVLIPVVALEGDIRTQDYVQRLSLDLKLKKSAWGLPYDTKILMIYPDRDSMKNDIIRDDIELSSVCITNLEDMKIYESTNQPIKFYDITRKGEISFDEATRCDES